MPGEPRLSGVQRAVLSLYRKCLREISKKPEASQANFRAYARDEFQRNGTLDKKDFSTVEFLLRKGQRQLDVYAGAGTTNIRR